MTTDDVLREALYAAAAADPVKPGNPALKEFADKLYPVIQETESEDN